MPALRPVQVRCLPQTLIPIRPELILLLVLTVRETNVTPGRAVASVPSLFLPNPQTAATQPVQIVREPITSVGRAIPDIINQETAVFVRPVVRTVFPPSRLTVIIQLRPARLAG